MPRAVRTTGIAVGYALTSHYLLVWLQHAQMAWIFPVYGSVIAVLSVVVDHVAKKRGHVYIGD